MTKVLISPGKYLQGAGELKNIGSHTKVYGNKPLVIISSGGYKRFGDVVKSGFEAENTEAVFEFFNGECSKNEINRLKKIVIDKECDSLRFYYLGNKYQTKIEHIGMEKGISADDILIM